MVGTRIGPLPQGSLDESLGLSVGLGGVGSGSDVPEAEPFAGPREGEGFVARAVIGHDALHLDAEACVVSDGGFEEGDSAAPLLVFPDLAEGDARGIVDADMDELPTRALAAAAPIALASAVARDAMADTVDSAELFDVDVDEFAGVLAFIAAHRLSRFQGPELVQAQALQNAADGRRRDPDRGRDRLAGQPLAPKSFDAFDDRCRRRPVEPLGPRAAVL